MNVLIDWTYGMSLVGKAGNVELYYRSGVFFFAEALDELTYHLKQITRQGAREWAFQNLAVESFRELFPGEEV